MTMNHSLDSSTPPQSDSDTIRDCQAELVRVCDSLHQGGHLRIAVEHHGSFSFRRSHVRQFWVESSRLGLVLPNLSPARLDALWEESLLFISFLIYIKEPPKFYTRLPELLFHPQGETPLFQDARMPYNQAQLDGLGLSSPPESALWEKQHLFTPGTLRLNSRTLEEQPISDKLAKVLWMEHEEIIESGGYGKIQFYNLAADDVEVDDRFSQQSLASKHVQNSVLVAVKSFHDKDSPNPLLNGQAEVANLRMLRQEDNAGLQSIVLASAVVRHPHRGLLIFYPPAELGDLGHFLRGGRRDGTPDHPRELLYDFGKRFPRAKDTWGRRYDTSLAQALLKQCVGLASALEFLHEGRLGMKVKPRWVHMDLKPENIVIFSGAGDVGHWKLCDFGLSVSDEEQKKGHGDDLDFQLRRVGTMDIHPPRVGGQYQAPEATDKNISHVGRSSDIWSFGCIFAEVLAFALGGPGAVNEFQLAQRQPTTYGCDYSFHSPSSQENGSPRVVNPGVLMWLKQQCRKDRSPPVWPDCWAGHVTHILQVDRNERPLAEKLVGYVKHLLEDAEQSTRGWTTKCEKSPYKAGEWSEQLPEEEEVIRVYSSSHFSVVARTLSPILEEHPITGPL